VHTACAGGAGGGGGGIELLWSLATMERLRWRAGHCLRRALLLSTAALLLCHSRRWGVVGGEGRPQRGWRRSAYNDVEPSFAASARAALRNPPLPSDDIVFGPLPFRLPAHTRRSHTVRLHRALAAPLSLASARQHPLSSVPPVPPMPQTPQTYHMCKIARRSVSNGVPRPPAMGAHPRDASRLFLQTLVRREPVCLP
jgi:hypothetical protein